MEGAVGRVLRYQRGSATCCPSILIGSIGIQQYGCVVVALSASNNILIDSNKAVDKA